MVYPSGRARATYSAAMLPFAPVLFSTMIGFGTMGRICSTKNRTHTSAPLPAGNAQTTWISRDGYESSGAASDLELNIVGRRPASASALRRVTWLLSDPEAGVPDWPSPMSFNLDTPAKC